MKPKTILVRLDCDLRRLPLSAKEAYLVSQLDGTMSIEDVSELTGTSVDEVIELAGRLTLFGVVKARPADEPPTSARGAVSRIDPRAEVDSVRPPRPEMATPITRPATPNRGGLGTREQGASPRERRRSTRSLRAMRAASIPKTPAPAAASAAKSKPDEVCELDAATQEKIRAMDAKIERLDHYGVLDVERGAEKKQIKRAYFALAASFHPDRFFGKKLGPLRAPLERVFHRITEANDVLTADAARSAYDARLGPAPAKKPSIARRLSKRLRQSALTPQVVVDKAADPTAATCIFVDKSANALAAAAVVAPEDVAPVSTAQPIASTTAKLDPSGPTQRTPKFDLESATQSTTKPDLSGPTQKTPKFDLEAITQTAKLDPNAPTQRIPRFDREATAAKFDPNGPTQRMAKFDLENATHATTAVIARTPECGSPIDESARTGRFRRLQAAAQNLAAATRAEPLIKAAEEALRAGDIVAAANNFRIALTMHDEPYLRQKFEAIDAQARDIRHEKHLGRARAAERSERWDEAADQYQRANEARRSAATAERAAYALRMSRGDLRVAASLAEYAVEQDGRNVEHRTTLGEIYFSGGFIVRAKEECDVALSLGPSHPRAKALATAIRARS